MPTALRAPRINNNDDTVKLCTILVAPGARVARGEVLFEVETDKATHAVEAEAEGYVLSISGQVGDKIAVGAVVMWMGATPNEAVPDAIPKTTTRSANGSGPAKEPSLKAAILLARHGLRAADVPASGDRLSVTDVERYLADRGTVATAGRAEPQRTSAPAWPGPAVAHETEALSTTDAGMLRTVLWHQREAVPGYVEIAWDSAPWDEYARSFQERHKLFMSPLLPLLAYQLVQLAAKRPAINATVSGEQRLRYTTVNLGFTVQSGAVLYLAVVEGAQDLSAKDFVMRLGELQRLAMKNKLKPNESSGATIGFTSMARWNVTRHVPILPPYTSFMLAHAATVAGSTVLGATYDHRLLTGGDAVAVLNEMRTPRGGE